MIHLFHMYSVLMVLVQLQLINVLKDAKLALICVGITFVVRFVRLYVNSAHFIHYGQLLFTFVHLTFSHHGMRSCTEAHQMCQLDLLPHILPSQLILHFVSPSPSFLSVRTPLIARIAISIPASISRTMYSVTAYSIADSTARSYSPPWASGGFERNVVSMIVNITLNVSRMLKNRFFPPNYSQPQ
jgi:hypothetical protein